MKTWSRWGTLVTNLVEKRMVHKTFVYVCQVLVMKLNHFSNKNLGSQHLSQFSHQELIAKSLKHNVNKTLPVPAGRPRLSCLPVKKSFLALESRTNIKEVDFKAWVSTEYMCPFSIQKRQREKNKGNQDQTWKGNHNCVDQSRRFHITTNIKLTLPKQK